MSLRERLEDAFCVYKSTRFIRVKNKKLVTVYYITILFVLLYIGLYTIYAEKGYQTKDQVTGTTSAKLKGTGSVNGSIGTTTGTVFDAMDLVVPSVEEDAFFVTTSMILTPNQSRSICAGNDDVSFCNDTTPCSAGTYSPKSQGIYTGKCSSNNRCEVRAWCPLEDTTEHAQTKNQVVNMGAFTAFVKVDVAFSEFGISQSNTLDKNNDGAPINGYNLFSVDDIVKSATDGTLNASDSTIVSHGAIILMESNWNCDLDQPIKKCGPKWKFFRIDSQPGTMSYGYNYRVVTYDVNMERRMLRKLYGIRVVFTVSGTGSKFSFSALTVTFGAGLAYLGVAAFLTDIVLENFISQSDLLGKFKNKVVEHRLLVNESGPSVVKADLDYHDLSSQSSVGLNDR